MKQYNNERMKQLNNEMIKWYNYEIMKWWLELSGNVFKWLEVADNVWKFFWNRTWFVPFQPLVLKVTGFDDDDGDESNELAYL